MSKLQSMHWRQHVALDVGTATTRVATGMSSIIQRPSLAGDKRALANGVIVDAEAVQLILKPMLERAKVFGVVRPCVLACAPSDARREERQLLADSIMKAGAASLSMIPEPLAAAIGSGVDVSSQYAQMIIDIGEGITDSAIIQSSKIRTTCAVRKGCADMRQAIVKSVKSRSMFCDDGYAEKVMRSCGLVGSPAFHESALVAAALENVLDEISDTMALFIKELPHSLGCDVIDSGICLTGGGALIPGLPQYLEQRLGIKISVSGNPLSSVAEGARAVLPVISSLNEWDSGALH
jgi:rod shape-determining protein MreB and related proteins